MAESPGLRHTILKQSFATIGQADGVALVGIFFESRIVLSRDFSRLLPSRAKVADLEPLDPRAAAELVGELYGLDTDALLHAFHDRWGAMRGSPAVKGLVADIEAHAYVDLLEPCEAT